MDQDRILEEKTAECMKLMSQNTKNTFAGTNQCGTIWDGIICWPVSALGLHYKPCPGYIMGFDTESVATKLCTKNGWWINPQTNKTWTNFTECIAGTIYLSSPSLGEVVDTNVYEEYKEWLPKIKFVSQLGYSVSLVTLVIAFVILAANKKLRCPRTMLHLHLFAAFILKATVALLKDRLFVEGIGLSNNVFLKNGTLIFTREHHTWECKGIIIIWQYFILSSYSWLLVEGLYLHNLIFLALFNDNRSIHRHVIIGWGTPMMVVIPWAVIRSIYDDTLCWTTHSNRLHFLIIRIPITASILINLLLFINITRVLLQKLKSTESYFELRKYTLYRKWVKSTFLLMPLYGVHYSVFLAMTYSIGVDPTVEIVWLFCDQLFTSFQGFCVALLYCILNGEVLAEMRTQWSNFRQGLSIPEYEISIWRKSSNTRSTATAVVSIQEQSC